MEKYINRIDYRILSLKAATIYKHYFNKTNLEIDLSLDNLKNKFNNSFDFSLDKIHLDKILKHKDKPLKDDYDNLYLTIIINVTFSNSFHYKKQEKNKEVKKTIKTIELRKHLYENGFVLNGQKYVRYKRSCGSSRDGSCLFIRSDYYDEMTKWSNANLKHKVNKATLASWEAYRALSLSSIEDIIDIPLKGILVIDDRKSRFKEKAFVVESKKKEISIDDLEEVTVSEKITEVENTIWDGEALLDDSLFTGNYSSKSMMLLRNKFFKSCGFRTNLQEFFKDNNINTIDDLNSDCITFTSDIKDIVMVVTKSSLKFIKFMNDKLDKANIEKWYSDAGSTFGIVKHDKKTPYFDGRMVETNYQFINTLHLNKDEAKELLNNSISYAKKVWGSEKNISSLMYHLEEANKRDVFDEKETTKNNILPRNKILLYAMKKNTDILKTRYYKQYQNETVRNYKKNLRNGNILIKGTYATLFGNGLELLFSLTKDYDGHKFMKDNTIYCKKFKQDEIIIGARSPHITMGNLLVRTNDINNEYINKYFPNLTEEIVCVNAIEENIQQLLNGCDYDSDTILLTNDELIRKAVLKEENKFLVPVCKIKEANPKKKDENISELELLINLDYNSSNNKIGDIVNDSQILNSALWDKYNKTGEIDNDIYKNICILAVLSGIAIDSAKKTYNIDIEKTLDKIEKGARPLFFTDMDKENKEKYNYSKKYKKNDENIDETIEEIEAKEFEDNVDLENEEDEVIDNHNGYDTAMDYIYVIPNKEINLKIGSNKQEAKKKFIDLFDFDNKTINSNPSKTYYNQCEKIKTIISDSFEVFKKELSHAFFAKKIDNNGYLNISYKNIRDEKSKARKQIKSKLYYNKKITIETLKLLLNDFDNFKSKKGKNNYIFYGLDLLLSIRGVFNLLKDNRHKEVLKEIYNNDINQHDKDSIISLHDFNFISVLDKTIVEENIAE